MPIEESVSHTLVSSPPANPAPPPATSVQSGSLHGSTTPVLANTSPEPNLTQSKESPLTDIGKSPPPFSLPFDFTNNGLTPLSESLDLLSTNKEGSNYESSELSDLGDDQSEAETDKMDFLDEQHSSSNNVADLDALAKLTELARLKEIDSDDDSDEVSPATQHTSMNGSTDAKKRAVPDDSDHEHESKKHHTSTSVSGDDPQSPLADKQPQENGMTPKSTPIPSGKTDDTLDDAESDTNEQKSGPEPLDAESHAKAQTHTPESIDSNETSRPEDQHVEAQLNGSISGDQNSGKEPIPELTAKAEAELEADLDAKDEADQEEEKTELKTNGSAARLLAESEHNENIKAGDQTNHRSIKDTLQINLQSEQPPNSGSEAENGVDSESEKRAEPKATTEPQSNSEDAEPDVQPEDEDESEAPKEDEDDEKPTRESDKAATEESHDDGNEHEVEEEVDDENEEDYHMNEQRKLAVEELRTIEKSFADLRDKLYHDKLSFLEQELQLCLDGSHPELSKIYYKINGFYQDSLRLANSTLSYKLKCIDTETAATRTSIHQNFLKKLMDSKNDMILNTTSLWYKINKERNQMDQLVPDYGFTAIPQIPNYTVPGTLEDASAVSGLNSMMNGNSHMEIPTEPIQLTKKAIKQNTIVELVQQRNNSNHQLGILNGLLHFHGFPSVVTPGDIPLKNQELLMKRASDEEIAEDFKAMGIPI